MTGNNKKESKPKEIQNFVRRYKYNPLLAFGILCIIVGIILLVAKIASVKYSLFFSKSVFFLFVGAVFLYLHLAFLRKAWAFYVGLLFLSNGFFFLLLDSEILPFKVYQLWPLVVILSGVSLIPAGYYRFKKIAPVYFIPAVVLMCMGVFFMLFSLNIIDVPFRIFAAMWWPLLLVVVGITLLCVFVYAQHNHQDTNQNISDDYEDFS